MDSAILIKDRKVELLNKQIINDALIYQEHNKMVDGYKADIGIFDKKLKKNRIIARLSATIAVVFAIVAIAK